MADISNKSRTDVSIGRTWPDFESVSPTMAGAPLTDPSGSNDIARGNWHSEVCDVQNASDSSKS